MIRLGYSAESWAQAAYLFCFRSGWLLGHASGIVSARGSGLKVDDVSVTLLSWDSFLRLGHRAQSGAQAA